MWVITAFMTIGDRGPPIVEISLSYLLRAQVFKLITVLFPAMEKDDDKKTQTPVGKRRPFWVSIFEN